MQDEKYQESIKFSGEKKNSDAIDLLIKANLQTAN